MRGGSTGLVVASVIGFWRAWPLWVAYAASAAAAGFAGVLLTAALAGHRSMLGLPNLAWAGAAVLLAGSAIAAATVRPWGLRLATGAVLAGVWAVAALALAGSCLVLLNLIELVLTGSVRDADGNSDWLAFAERLGLAVIAALFMGTALSWRRRTAGTCPRCGQTHSPQLTGRRYAAPHAAPLAVRRAAYAGCFALAPYTTLHTLGALGYSGIEPDGFRPSWAAALAFYCGIALAVFLLLGLVRPWGMLFPRWVPWLAGRRVPRSLPLTPVWAVAPTLAIYGVASLVYVVLVATHVVRWDGEIGMLGVAAPTAFAGYGCALAVAAVSYARRTKPSCAAATP